jgi:hypothetical protein
MKRKDGVQIYLFQDSSTENIIDTKTSQCTGRYGVSKEGKKKTELQTSSTNTDRVNEKLLDMEHG